MFKERLSEDVKIKSTDGKEMKAIDVFSAAINFLRGHLLDTLEKRATGVRETDIQWVLTVPAIWDDAAKQFMRVAAEKVSYRKHIEILVHGLLMHNYLLIPSLVDGLLMVNSKNQ